MLIVAVFGTDNDHYILIQQCHRMFLSDDDDNDQSSLNDKFKVTKQDSSPQPNACSGQVDRI